MRQALTTAFLLVAACTHDVPSGRRRPDPLEHPAGRSGLDGAPTGDGGQRRGNTVATADNALTVHVEDVAGLRIEVVTLACAGACADVMAVARGGNPPYRFIWEDGSTDTARRVCLDASAALNASVTDTAIESDEFSYRAHTSTVALSARVLACTDAGAGDVPDAGPESLCATGESAVGDPLGGTVTYFQQGAALPSGRYRVSYVDGCMRFGPVVDWTIHNQLPVSWFLVGETAANVLETLPGVTGLGYPSFDECVAESRRSPPVELEFAGGKLGVVMVDYPLDDNVAGIDGRNPEWCLTPL